MEGHYPGMFDNEEAGARRNIILGYLDRSNINLQVCLFCDLLCWTIAE